MGGLGVVGVVECTALGRDVFYKVVVLSSG